MLPLTLDEAHAEILALREEKAKLEAAAVTDTLTGVANRRGLERAMTAARSRSGRGSGTALAAVLLDLDDFKGVNDRWGHAEGDLVLQRVGCVLQLAVRVTDAVGRWGGEEFLIVTENTSAGAYEFAERLRVSIAATVFAGPHEEPVTASFGVSGYRGVRDFYDLSHAILRADVALYRAKAKGRNRVEFE